MSLFTDCIVSSPTRWPGQLKLELCSSQEQFDAMQQHPGTWMNSSAKVKEEIGFYLPFSLISSGMYPANLEDYEPEPNATTPAGLKLYEYQARAVTFLRNVSYQREGAILAASPGLAKTVTALQALYLDNLLYLPGLVIGPNICKVVWCDQDSDAKKHYGLDILALEGVKSIDTSVLSKHKHFFCHFELLRTWQPWIFMNLKPAWLIIDEGHLLSNKKAQRSAAALAISTCASIQRRYELTGTPIPNERMDLWHQLALVQPRQWGYSYMAFGVRYCAGSRLPPEQGGHWNFSGESNDTELRARLAGTFLRYTTEDVETALPPLQRHIIDVDCNQDPLMEDYSAAQGDIVKYLKNKTVIKSSAKEIVIGTTKYKITEEDKKNGATRLVCLSVLIGLISRMKQAAAIKTLDRIAQTHDRIVVFTWRVESAIAIYDHIIRHSAAGGMFGDKVFTAFGPVYSNMSLDRRISLAKEFAAEPRSFYVATMGSAGASINPLSAGTAALMVDLHWNTPTLRQAEKRLHRIGSTASQVDIYYLVARKTVDELFIEALRKKAECASNVTRKEEGDLRLVRDLSVEGEDEEADFELLIARLMDDK